MVYRETIAVCLRPVKKHTNARYGQKVEVLLFNMVVHILTARSSEGYGENLFLFSVCIPGYDAVTGVN
jgi:hypothetical protein